MMWETLTMDYFCQEKLQFKDEDMKTANSKTAVVGLATQDTRYLNMAHALQSLVFALQLSVLFDPKSLMRDFSLILTYLRPFRDFLLAMR